MPKPHDMGGEPNDEPIDQSDHQKMDWEMRVDALHQVLGPVSYTHLRAHET